VWYRKSRCLEHKNLKRVSESGQDRAKITIDCEYKVTYDGIGVKIYDLERPVRCKVSWQTFVKLL